MHLCPDQDPNKSGRSVYIGISGKPGTNRYCFLGVLGCSACGFAPACGSAGLNVDLVSLDNQPCGLRALLLLIQTRHVMGPACSLGMGCPDSFRASLIWPWW